MTFLGHTDTVPPGENWSTDPFKMKVCDDKIYGLGSADMKGGITCLLSCLAEIDIKALNKRSLNILLTYDEEANFCGIFTPKYSTFNIGKIKGGDAINKVPGSCAIEMECRTISKYQNNEIIQNIQKIANKYSAEVQIKDSISPTMCDGGDFIKNIEKITGNKGVGVNYFTDGSFLDEVASKMIILGPGPFNSHKPDEWVSKKSLYETKRVYKEIIERYL